MQNKKCMFRLYSCVWEITLACCFSCNYCGSKAGKARKNELTTEECLSVAHQLAEIGCRRVSLIGGEVFMRPDWLQIVKALTDRKIKVTVITNGYLFSDKLLADIKSANIESFAISLDGPQNIHDAFRQTGSFQRAMDTIDILTQNYIPVSVISTLHSKNYKYLDEMYELLKTKKIFAWQIQACSPMGNAAEETFQTEIDFRYVIDFVGQHIHNPYFAVGAADNIGYYTEKEGSLRGNTSGKAVFLGCGAGLDNIGIDSEGNVRGCEAMYDESFIEGNLRNRSLYDIWNDPGAFSYNRQFTPEKLSGKCKDCEYGCKCAGGCRSYNYFATGKLYESPYCARQSREKEI